MQKAWRLEKAKWNKNASFESHRGRNLTALLKVLVLWCGIVQGWMGFETGNLDFYVKLDLLTWEVNLLVILV